jgi:hypothetical protein
MRNILNEFKINLSLRSKPAYLLVKERQWDRETERQRDRETERQRDRETERQRDRETERHIDALTLTQKGTYTKLQNLL